MQNRREFLKKSVSGMAAAPLAAAAQAAVPTKKMIGTKVGAVSFVDEGTSKVRTFYRNGAL